MPDLPSGEVISIGDEMTSGARLDTNAQWLSRRLGDLGVGVQFHSTVGDTLSHNVDVFRIAAERADVIVCTGGLGPTQDDLTRQALADMLGRPLEFRKSSLEHIERLFARRSREMPERNRVQAMFPEGSSEILNPQGTAPGIDATFTRQDGTTSRLFCLPGVPAEMKRMFDDTVAPRIMSLDGEKVHIEHAVMKFFGVGESDMEQRLGDMIARDREPRVGITVSAATISLRISARGVSRVQCLRQIEATREEILQRVGELHFGDGEDFEQYHAVESRLANESQTLTTVEFGHAAMLAAWFATLGKSDAYQGGFYFADATSMRTALDLDPEHALDQLRARADADWLLLVDAYPSLSPDGKTAPVETEKPLPAAEVKLSVIDAAGKATTTIARIGGHPSIVHARIGKAALAWFRKVLANAPASS
ncbi:MAG: molybdopterin-binding protein [Planctomycetota bacterium]